MKKRWPASAALLCLVAGTISFFLITNIIVFWESSNNNKEHLIENNMKIIEAGTQYQEQVIQRAKILLESLAKFPAIINGNPVEVFKLFKIIEQSQPNFNDLNLFTLEGEPVVSVHAGRNSGFISPNVVVQRQYFKDALATKSFSVGKCLTSACLLHTDSLPVSIPVYNANGEPKYVLMIAINVQKIVQYFMHPSENNNIIIQIYDKDKVLIATTNDSNKHLIGSAVKLEYISGIIDDKGRGQWTETKDALGNGQITSLATLKLDGADSPYLYFVVNTTMPTMWAFIKNLYLLELVGIFLALLASLVLAYWTGYYYFNHGFEQLTYVATSAQNGNISIRNGYIRGCSELQSLGKSFDIMLKNLEFSSTHLHEQKARLDFALNGAQVATWEWDTLSKKYLLDRRGISLLGYINYPDNFIDLGALMQKYDLQQAQITMEQHVEDKIPNFEYEVKLLHQNGSHIWFVLQGRKEITTVTHDVQSIFGICIDITQRKKLERFEIERAEYFKRLSHKDALTGLSNRRHFIEQAQIMVQHSLRHGHSFSLGMLDLDFFKKINDTHGHVVGDQVLKALADLLTESVRKTDLVGRYGGEEFIIFLPETDENKAISAAEKLRKSIMNLVVYADSTEITFTASIGFCTYTPAANVISSDEKISSTIVEITSIADNNLYIAKDSGRNRVVGTLYEHPKKV